MEFLNISGWPVTTDDVIVLLVEVWNIEFGAPADDVFIILEVLLKPFVFGCSSVLFERFERKLNGDCDVVVDVDERGVFVKPPKFTNAPGFFSPSVWN